MAFYAQYHQQPFGSNPHGYNYTAYGWDDQTYQQHTTCDDSSFAGFPPQPYQNMNDRMFNPDHLMLHGAASPVKGDFILDNQPSLLSSTSDSGASFQSSSNTGSPSAPALNDWNQFGLCDNGNPITAFEPTANPGDAKVGCVGEFTSVSSCHNFSFLSLSAHAPTGESWAGSQLGSPSPNTLSSYQMPQVIPRQGSTGVLHNMESAELANVNIVNSSQPSSPVLERVKGQRRTSALPSPKHMRVKTRLARPSSAGGDMERLYAPRSPLQSHFFCQSSGLFVPPLGASRPSPFSHSFLFSLCRYGGGKSDRY